MATGGGPVDMQGRPLAEWWKRVVAAIIDGIIISIPFYILTAIFSVGISSTVECDPVTGICEGGGGFIAGFFISWLIFMVLAIAYYVYFHGNEKGQTPGKMIMKIQVRDEATGGPLGYGKAALRWLVAGALGFLCGIGSLLDALWPLWDPKRQALHDKAVSTVVIDVGP